MYNINNKNILSKITNLANLNWSTNISVISKKFSILTRMDDRDSWLTHVFPKLDQWQSTKYKIVMKIVTRSFF